MRGIDFRPATGQLYASAVVTGSAANSVVFTYVIDPATAVATPVGQTAAALFGAADVPTGYDFNPTSVDRIRYVNTNDENARLNPNTGGLAGNDTDLQPAVTSTIIAEALDRNIFGTAPTTLYAIDRNDSMLSIQGGINGAAPGGPNAGVVTDLAPLGFTLNGANDGGFDISPGGIAYAALTDDADDLTRLYTINLSGSSNVATSLGLIGNGATEVRSLAIAPPAPASEPAPEPTAKADRGLTFDASKNKVKKGKKVRLSGQLDAPANEVGCESGQTVDLQRQKGKGDFETFEQLQTDAAGSFATKEKVKKTFTYRATVGETDACGAGVSNTDKVKAKKKT